MSTAATKFEVKLPQTADTTVATTAFLTSLAAITPYTYESVAVYDGTNPAPTFFGHVYGILTAPQAATALAALTTLNTALGSTVECISYTVQVQP